MSQSIPQAVQTLFTKSHFGRDIKLLLCAGLDPYLPSVLIEIIFQYGCPFTESSKLIIGAQDFTISSRWIIWRGDALQKLVFFQKIPCWEEVTSGMGWRRNSRPFPRPNYRTMVWKHRTRPPVRDQDKDRWVFVHFPGRSERHCGFLFPSTTSKREFLLGLRLVHLYITLR